MSKDYPEIGRLAAAMKYVLEGKEESKISWKDETVTTDYLFQELELQNAKLILARYDCHPQFQREEIKKRLIHMANYIMMLYDKYSK